MQQTLGTETKNYYRVQFLGGTKERCDQLWKKISHQKERNSIRNSRDPITGY